MLPDSKSFLKVGMKLLWNSRNQKFVGHAMTHDEMTTLCDVYQTLQPSFHQKRTSYVLQTLWQDLTSDFDIVGPHYTSEGTVSVSVHLTTNLLFIECMCICSINSPYHV